ncbi:MAG: glycosyltransferase family 1 protein [Chloroflexi bacterium]|nr:MAG: glycosyltransferase family 1 protein [Chloroflexota bacterium]RLC94174.1 MAG: glycosyltransferase family 1 protein [Chloroflexota bacterium]
MKICLLSYRGEPYCGGQGVYIHNLSRELCNLGHEVHLLSGNPHPRLVDAVTLDKLESLDLYGVNRGRLPPRPLRILTPLNLYEFCAVLLGTFPEPFTFSIRAYLRLRQLLAGQRFDVVHDNQCLGYGLVLMKGLGLPVVATIHHPVSVDRDIEIGQAGSRWWRFRMRRWYSFVAMQHRVGRRIDRIVTVSKRSADDIARDFSIPKDRIRVVYNGVDTDLFTPDDSVRKEANSLITVGGAGQIKGLCYLLKALHLLREELDVKLTIVGKPPTDGHFPANLIREYGLQDRVRFTGRVSAEALVGHYSAAEVAVVPSLYEGFGFPAAEAMSCKLPLISTTGGALPEVTGKDGEAGMLVPPRNADALAAAIRRMLADEALRRKMGEAGRQRVVRKFTWREAAKKTVEVYQELM